MIKKGFKVGAAFLQGPNCPENSESVGNYNVASALQDALEHARKMETAARLYHWNIVGSDFRRLHLMFEDEYKKLAEDIDTIAENIRQAGYFVDCLSLPSVEVLRDGKNQVVAYRDLLREDVKVWKKVNAEAKAAENIQVEDLSAEILRSRSKSLYFFESLLAGNLTENQSALASARRVTAARKDRESKAGLDAMLFKEEKTLVGFFDKLKQCISDKLLPKVKTGIETACAAIAKLYPKASIRYFADPTMGGYVRVELEDKVYVVTYNDDLEETKKVKVFTAELKNNIPVNNFSMSDFSQLAKTSTKDLPEGFMPVWYNG